MGKVTQNQKDWQAGYDAGKTGKPGHAPKGVDGLSWMSGYVEGKGIKNQMKFKKNKAHKPVII
jgi:hypothetical protein